MDAPQYSHDILEIHNFFIYLTVFLVAFVALRVAYFIGGAHWNAEFSIKTQHSSVSGWYGESIILGTAIAGFFVCDQFITDSSAVHLIYSEAYTIYYLLIAVTLIVVLYSIYAVISRIRDARTQTWSAGWVRRYIGAYALYNVYSIVMFGGFFLFVILMFKQLLGDQGRLSDNRITLGEEVSRLTSAGMGHDISSIQSQIEIIYGQLLITIADVMSQINTIFLFLLLVLIINFVIKYTPARNAYSKEAVHITTVVTIVSSVAVVVASLFIYFGSYGSMIDEVRAAVSLDSVRSAVSSVGGGQNAGGADESYRWEILERYNSILVELAKRRGLFGFVSQLANESAGLVLVIGAANGVMARMSAKNNG